MEKKQILKRQGLTILDECTFNHWIAAGFGSGWLPKAPGTWGSLVSLLPGWSILVWGGATGLIIASAIVLIVGCLVCAAVLPTLEEKDPGWIVIDEWAGQWLCLGILAALMGKGGVVVLIAFVAFRLFDIFKPWPISWAETAGPPWWSIMADDVLAGLMGAVSVMAVVQVAAF